MVSASTVTATGAGTLLPRRPFRSSVPSSVTPSCGIALPPCLVSNALDRCNYRPNRTSMVTNVGPQAHWFSLILTVTHPLCHCGGFHLCFFCLRGACGRVWVSLLYVSMNCFLTCLEYYLSQVLGGGDFSYGFGVFDFSHEEVKRAVVGIKIFFTP